MHTSTFVFCPGLIQRIGASALFALALCGGVASCSLSTHAVRPSELGTARAAGDLLAVIDEPGTVAVETVVSADWTVPRAGLINLAHPTAKAAGLKDGDEPVQVFFHVLRHPQKGVFLVDTGVEKAATENPKAAAYQGTVAAKLRLDKLKMQAALGTWLAAHPDDKPQGVLLTHLHLDHIWGMPDVPAATRIYAGPGETAARAVVNGFLRPNTDRALAGKPAIEEWAFKPDPAGRFEGVLDVFGDGMVWALLVPGHTDGSTAYLIRTPQGPVLLTGDTCHTRWGWEHDVEPGTFTKDHPKNAQSLARLRRLAAEHPKLDVRLGHQK